MSFCIFLCSVIFGPESHSSAESWQMSEILEVSFTVEDKSVDIFQLGLVIHIYYKSYSRHGCRALTFCQARFSIVVMSDPHEGNLPKEMTNQGPSHVSADAALCLREESILAHLKLPPGGLHRDCTGDTRKNYTLGQMPELQTSNVW